MPTLSCHAHTANGSPTQSVDSALATALASLDDAATIHGHHLIGLAIDAIEMIVVDAAFHTPAVKPGCPVKPSPIIPQDLARFLAYGDVNVERGI